MRLLKQWSHVQLNSVCSKIGSGATPRGGESVYVEEGTAIIRSQNVYNGLFTTDGLAHLTEEHAEQLKGVTVEPRDVLLNITGDSVARCCLVPDWVLPARVNQHVSIMRPDSDQLLPEFLCYYFVSPLMQKYLLSRGGSGGTRNALTKGMIAAFEVPCPPLVTQQRIVDLLKNYDYLIENNRRRIQLLEQAARLLYREWFVYFRFPDHEHVTITDGMPEGWEKKTVLEVIEIKPKEAVSKGTPIRYVPMTCLSTTGMTVDLSDVEVRTKSTSVRYRNGDILFARITPCLENGKTGFVNFLREDEVACGSTEFIVLRGSSVSPYFAYCLARTHDFRETAIKSMIGSSGRQRVQPSCFDDFIVARPPRFLRDEFDRICEPIFSQIAELSSQVQSLTQARDLLLPRLMNGEVAV